MGEIHDVRWDFCRIRIFTKPERGPNGEYGTRIRLVTQNMRMEGSIDQRTLFLEHCELIPEYAFHDQILPVVYIRKIATKIGKRVSNASTTIAGSNVKAGSTKWDDNSLYYRFGSLEDMFNFQLAFLGELVEMDICSIPTIRYKRRVFDGEHTHYRARAQIWRENSDASLNPAFELHTHYISSAPSSNTQTYSFRAESIPDSSALTKVYSPRIVLYWENGGGVILFLSDSIELEVRNNGINNSSSINNNNSRDNFITNSNGSATTLTPTSPTTITHTSSTTSSSSSGDRSTSSGAFLLRRPSTVNNCSTTSTDTPVGNFVLRIKPTSTPFSKLQGGSFKARLLSPGQTSASGFRLDKQGLRWEDCENGVDGWEEYRWFEIEFRREVEMSSFMADWTKWLNERRKEKRRREGEMLRMPTGGTVAGGKGGKGGGGKLRKAMGGC
ncbi:hypothetical protein L211DRAFT_95646 [Terfezia boudieri ATCC MYA-4762]|uniref:Uncharacterized protein n=1 Tax=Terfezia boudieri ATCC MYA-4762 TaxID=1051890 RepID=A0A3N4LYB5_9PEZI|nr:hypothetical protein L211DRAFT_95646 [Terfezia boudieri ATCC MYA-4762]